MENRDQLMKLLAGALIGAGFAFLFLTKGGHRMLDNAEPWLEDMVRDFQRLRNAAAKAIEAVDEGRRSFAAVSEAIPFGHSSKSWQNEPHH